MTTPLPPGHHDSEHDSGTSSHSGHRWMMIACCIPMLVVVAALVISGVAGTGAILVALGCLAMMWVMMKAMPGGH